MCAPLSAAVTFTKIGCAFRAVWAALMRAPLASAMNNTKLGCALREVWLTSRMRAHASLPFRGPGARCVALRRIAIRIHACFKCKETGLGAKKREHLAFL
jgi:hypothetical protein